MTLRAPLPALLLLAACASTPEMGVQSFLPVDDGMQLYFEQAGEGEEVLIVPGASWLAADVMPLARGRTVVFYDLRGRGRSSSLPPGALPTLSHDVADLEALRASLGVERFAILAHDYQATVAAEYAALHPDRVERMVLVSPLPVRRIPFYDAYMSVFNERLDKEAFLKVAVMFRDFVHRTDPEAYAQASRNALFSGWVIDQASLKAMRSNPLVEPNIDPEVQTGQYQAMMAKMGEWDWRPALRRVACPTLLVHGKRDPAPVRSAQEWVATIPGAQDLVIEDSGRMPWLEQPSRFFSRVERFLDGR